MHDAKVKIIRRRMLERSCQDDSYPLKEVPAQDQSDLLLDRDQSVHRQYSITLNKAEPYPPTSPPIGRHSEGLKRD